MKKKRGYIIQILDKDEEVTAKKIIKYTGVLLVTIGTFCLIAFAWFLIILGILGLLFPVIPGLFLITIGASLLGGKKLKKYFIKSTARIIRRIRKKFR